MNSNRDDDGLQPVGGGLAPLGGGAPQPPQPPVAPAAAVSPHPLYSPPIARPVPGAAAYDEPAGPGKAVVASIIAAIVLALGAVAFLVLRPAAPVPAPTSFSEWTAADRSISCETPDGWRMVAHGRASEKPEHVSQDGFEVFHGAARIEVTLSTVKGLMAQQLLLGDGPVPEVATGAGASGGIHSTSKKSVKSRFKNYKEAKIESPPFPCGMGGMVIKEGARSMEEALVADYQVSEFRADGNRLGLGGKVHGYRATLAGGEFIAAVVCQCPERDWQALKPAFHRVLGSLREAGGTRNPKGEDDEEDLSVPGTGVNVPGRLPGVGGTQ